jgi:hypothetical protein
VGDLSTAVVYCISASTEVSHFNPFSAQWLSC